MEREGGVQCCFHCLKYCVTVFYCYTVMLGDENQPRVRESKEKRPGGEEACCPPPRYLLCSMYPGPGS